MTRKILILNRKKNRLVIQDEDNEFSYSHMEGITHIEKTEQNTESEEKFFMF